MQQLRNLDDQGLYLEASIHELNKINKKIAALLLMKEELTEKVIGALGHEHEGQKTYEHRTWKIEVKTPCIYSLDKRLYESGTYKLPIDYNPIKESISYSIDKKLCDRFLMHAPLEVKNVLSELIEKRPGKATVTIKERV
jgi:hypothetical protein